MKNFVAALALIAAAGAANASQVTLSGGLSTTAGAAGVLGANAAPSLVTFSASSGAASVTGLVQASNSANGTTQVMTLVLTSFNFTNTGQGPVTISVHITQDYQLAATVAGATGSHQLNGNTAGTRTGTMNVVSTHESTSLPALNVPFANAMNFNAGQGAETTVPVIGGIYTIDTTYTFTIDGGTGSGSIILPNSGVDNATLTLVPLPPAAYAGMAGLAAVGFRARARRKAMAN